MTLLLSMFFQCIYCGKLHSRRYVGPATECTCGVNLYRQSFLNDPPKRHMLLNADVGER